MTDPSGTGALLQKTAGGAGWVIGWRATTRALGFISTLVLARILVPADFGLVALAMSFSRAVDILADMGVEDALVRAAEPTRDMYDTAFTMNAIRGLITAVIIGASAVPFARFFSDPRLTYVVLALACAVLLDAVENIGIADFRRHLAFRSEFVLYIFPRLSQVIITIILAFTWANYWALVVGILTARVLRITSSYIMHPYRPRLSLRAWHEIFGFSFWTWMISMAAMVRGRAAIMIIGRMLNTTLLGVYTVGAEIATLPESEFIDPLCRVCFASFSAARRGGISVADTYLRIISSTWIIALPASIGISSVAAPLVIVAFGAKWQQATPVVQILALAGLFAVMGRISSTLFSAYAYLRSLFSIIILMASLQLTLLVLFVGRWGIPGAAAATAVTVLLEQAIYSVLAFRSFSISPLHLVQRIWRAVLAAASMAAVLIVTGLGWAPAATALGSSAAHLFVTCASGAATYTGVLVGLWLASGRPKGPEADVLELVKRSASRLILSLGRRAALIRTAGPGE
jgi:O-antigen/teichoic acid export membrane protein